MNDFTHLVLPLDEDHWTRLLALITKPNGKHKRGGWQDRKRKWQTRLNMAAHMIELDKDDIRFVRNQIINKNGGGFQSYFYHIFAEQHPKFAGLPIAPRRKPSERTHRAVPTDTHIFSGEAPMKKVAAKKLAGLPDKLKVRAISDDLINAICGSTTHCTMANSLRRMFPGAFVRVVANKVTISFNGILYHYALPDSALRLVALNDIGTLTFADANRVVTLPIIDRRKAYVDLSPERRAGIRMSEAARRAAGLVKLYSKNTRVDAAKRAGRARKKLIAAEAATGAPA